MTDGQSTHGGARPGAGRPNAGTVQVLVRLKRATVQLLGRAVKMLPHEERFGAKSRIADQAITEYLSRNHTDQPRDKNQTPQ